MKEYCTYESTDIGQSYAGIMKFSHRPDYPWSEDYASSQTLASLIKQGWVVTSTAIEPGRLGSCGYREPRYLFTLERELTSRTRA